MKRPITLSLLLIAFWAFGQMETYMAQAQTGATPPQHQGASPTNETFSDWTLACVSRQGQRICAMSQHQRTSDNGQLVLAAEFNAVTPERMQGTLVLPFGLRLADGALPRVDEGAAMDRLAFSTCLPSGCLVPVDFGPDITTALRAGRVLTLMATAADSGQPVRLAVSLTGFSAARARALDLQRPE